MSSKTTYKDSGVDIDAGNEFVKRIKTYTDETKRNEVVSGIGGFAGLFSLNSNKYTNPVLVATTDGVGTKLKLAIECSMTENLGQDLVAMCVNDLICCGAEPLFFLDYFATGKLDIEQATSIIRSMTSCLKDINCTLLGGETAEMPGLYNKSDFDIAGFSVGVVDKSDMIQPSNVAIGNKVIAIASSGIHSNGYSLVRKIVADKNLNLNDVVSYSKNTLAQELLAPTVIYVKPVMQLIKQYKISAMAHITGGGLVENLPRVLPKKCQAVIEKNKIEVPKIFKFLQEMGHVDEPEMWRVFNMGIGFVMVVKADDEASIVDQLNGMKFKAVSIGTIKEKKSATDDGVTFV